MSARALAVNTHLHLVDGARVETMHVGNDRQLHAEASSLGLRAGEWPQVLVVVDDRGIERAETYGPVESRAYLFVRQEPFYMHEEFGGYRYRSGAVALTVFND